MALQATERLPLPIDRLMPDILRTVENSGLTLLEAEPGAGKTTRVPAALLDAGFGPVYVLEPRRLAARMAARRVAAERAERVGESVGYRVRFEQVGGAQTGLWYVTEGVLVQMLLGRTRSSMRTVIFDEFHERHLETDVALALVRRLAKADPRIRMLIMSATLGGEDLAARLGGAPVIRAPGRSHPVAVRYAPYSAAPVSEQVAGALQKVLLETSGHVLIFLPGAGEIRRTLEACRGLALGSHSRLLPLHGDLSPEEQDLAVAPSGERKIICSTNVAESSITIDGVTAVIDSGLARVLTHSASSGIAKLHVQKISRASAIQRSGRAGRTAPGLAVRLYTEADFARRPEHLAPEILRADLSELLLELAVGRVAWDHLPWLDSPPQSLVLQAKELLVRLGAIEQSGRATPLGRRMAEFVLHPRLSRFVVAAAGAGAAREACNLAALLSEGGFRFTVRPGERHGSDIERILASDISQSVRRVSQQIGNLAGKIRSSGRDPKAVEKALLLAYPDRVGRKRGETVLLTGGGSALLVNPMSVQSDFLVAIEIEDRASGLPPVITAASEMEPDWLLEFFPDRVTTRDELVWNRTEERVEQLTALGYGELYFEETRSRPSDTQAASAVLTEKALEARIQRFVDAEELRRFLNRVRFAAFHGGFTVPEDLIASVLTQLCAGLTSFAELAATLAGGAFFELMEARLPMKLVDQIAPHHVVLPSGRRARIEYYEDQPPSVSSRLQDFFGMRETPAVAAGRVPLRVHLLAPNQRPVQVTTDLMSFWETLYPQVRRELSRRYPRHAWPEKPI